MKLSKKDESLILIVLGLLLIVLTYFFVCKKLDEKTLSLKTENGTLQTVIVKMENHQRNIDFYKEEITRMEKEGIEIKNTYPSAIMNADKILYAKKLEDVCKLRVSYLGLSDMATVNVAYPNAELISIDAQISGQPAPVATANPNGIYMIQHGLALNYEGGYESIKQLLGFIVEDAQQKSIQGISLSYNESTGVLSGTMTASMYSMTGTSVVYSAPSFTGIPTGTDDIFKTFGEITDTEEQEEE